MQFFIRVVHGSVGEDSEDEHLTPAYQQPSIFVLVSVVNFPVFCQVVVHCGYSQWYII